MYLSSRFHEGDMADTLLDIALSKATDISVLGKLTMLRRLDISETNVKDICSLKELFLLSQLDMAWVPVTDISALSKLEYICKIEEKGLHLKVVPFLFNRTRQTALKMPLRLDQII